MSKGILFVILSCLVIDWAVAIIVWVTMLNPLRQEFVEGFKRGYNETKEQQTPPVGRPGPAGQDDRIVGIGRVQKEAPKPQDIPIPQRKPVPSIAMPPTMTLAAYLAQHPTQPVRVSVYAELDNLYFNVYHGREATHCSVRIRSRGKANSFGPSAGGWVYVPKDSLPGRQLYELLKDGDTHFVVLTLSLIGPDGKPNPAGVKEAAILAVEK